MHEVEERGYTFPYLYDEKQEVAKAYRAACTPDFYVFDKDQKLVYRGQMDDSRPGSDIPVTGKDLRAASTPFSPANRRRRSEGEHRLQHQMEAGRRAGLLWLKPLPVGQCCRHTPCAVVPRTAAWRSTLLLATTPLAFFLFATSSANRAGQPPSPDDVVEERHKSAHAEHKHRGDGQRPANLQHQHKQAGENRHSDHAGQQDRKPSADLWRVFDPAVGANRDRNCGPVVCHDRIILTRRRSFLLRCNPCPADPRRRSRGLAEALAATEPRTLLHKLRHDQFRNHAGRVPFGQQASDGLAAAVAEIERPIVDVHADELVRLGAIQVAAVLQRIVERSSRWREPVLDACLSRRLTSRITAGPRSLRMPLAPSGSGNPVLLVPPLAQIDRQHTARDRQT